MQPESGRHREPNGEPLLPPATTQWRPLAEPVQETTLPLAPFFPAGGAALTSGADDEAAEAWQPDGTEPDFPEDAFFYPEDTGPLRDAEPSSATGPLDDAAEEEALVLLDPAPDESALELRIAREVAGRLEQLAARLRQSGFAALAPDTTEPIDTVLAAVLSGYLAARAR